jgi:hypothetical protein
LVAAGVLSADVAQMLYSASPFHSEQLKARLNKFWMVSHPRAVDDGGVRPLLACWGGEVASMWTRDLKLLGLLSATGKPRIVELGVPMALTRHSYQAGVAIVATFGRSLSCIPSKHAFDLYAIAPLGPEAVLAVHTEGDANYAAMGRSYPDGFIDVDVGRWKELTGEEED